MMLNIVDQMAILAGEALAEGNVGLARFRLEVRAVARDNQPTDAELETAVFAQTEAAQGNLCLRKGAHR